MASERVSGKVSCPQLPPLLHADCPSRLGHRGVTALWEKPINYLGQRPASTPHTHSPDGALNHLLNDGASGGSRHLSEGRWASASGKVRSWRP